MNQLRLGSSIPAIVVILSACAIPNGGSEGAPGSSSVGRSCSYWAGAGLVAGWSSKQDKKAGRKSEGAVVGASDAFLLCTALSTSRYSVQQTRSEQQVKDAYLRVYGKAAPTVPTVIGHALHIFQERGQDAAGKSITLVNVRSDIHIVGGSQVALHVQEQLEVIGPDGTTKIGENVKTASMLAGGYATTTRIEIPDGLHDGQFQIGDIVILDGQAKSARKVGFNYVAVARAQ